MSYSLEEIQKIKAEKERMDAELRLASRIQMSMIPIGHMAQDGIDIFGSLVPAREMGGNLFDYGILFLYTDGLTEANDLTMLAICYTPQN